MENVFQDVVEKISDGVMVVDTQYNFVYANEANEKLGLDYQVIIGKSIFEVFPNLKKETSTFCQVIATKKPILEYQQTFITYRGEVKTTVTSTYPIIRDNKVIGAFEFFRDISILQKMEEQLAIMQQHHYKERTKKEDETESYAWENFIGDSKPIKELKSEIRKIANSPSPIFIYGETGTGKEVYVNAIQKLNHQMPIITQNCAAIPKDLLESYFFGTISGSFTGAVDRKGLFELANGGILFLDEINSLPVDLQAKLLRVIQEQKVRRVGGAKEFSIDVRIIAASNVHPEELLLNKELREDLYYRISVLNIEIPPLRSRKDDIPLLVNKFIEEYNELFNKNVVGLAEDALNTLYEYDWPGNIRELKNVIERLINLKESGYIYLQDIKKYNVLDGIKKLKTTFIKQNDYHKSKGSFKEQISQKEVEIIKNELFRTNGNISQASRNLDMPQQTLSNKIKRYNLNQYILEIKLLNNE